MPSTSNSETPVAIDGIPLDETIVPVAKIAEQTHGNFHNAVDVIRESNTCEGILRLLIAEVDELLEVLESETIDRLNLVSETGDLFHFWNDLFKLSGFSIESFLEHVGPALVNGHEATVDEVRQAAAQANVERSNARDLLYELKVLWELRELDALDEKTIGTVASHIFAVAADLDVNIIYATLMKNRRNRQKYNPGEMNALSIPYKESMRLKADKWNNGAGGDKEFFKAFLTEFPLFLSFSAVNSMAAD